MVEKDIERLSKGLALLRYIMTHKPDGADIEGLEKDLSTYCRLMIEHYQFCINKLSELEKQLKSYNADGWYQNMRKKKSLKIIKEQKKSFELEIDSFNKTLAQLN